MTGKILNVQRFCTMDGPGIRTTVFFKGCPLNCKWCHNPESQSFNDELAYDISSCVNCLRCVSACDVGCHQIKDNKHFFDRTNCVACGKCLQRGCDALKIYGKQVSACDVLTEVLKDKDYYDNSNGGVTLSGGEPLYQIEFCEELLKALKTNGISTCVETCGYVSQKSLEKTLDLVDLYLFDYKLSDEKSHLFYTGKDNRLIIDNLRFLDKKGKKIVLRCPIIPFINDNDGHFKKIGELANSLNNVIEVVVEPYHDFGVQKYARLSKDYTLDVKVPDEPSILSYVDEIKKYTNKKVVKA